MYPPAPSNLWNRLTFAGDNPDIEVCSKCYSMARFASQCNSNRRTPLPASFPIRWAPRARSQTSSIENAAHASWYCHTNSTSETGLASQNPATVEETPPPLFGKSSFSTWRECHTVRRSSGPETRSPRMHPYIHSENR